VFQLHTSVAEQSLECLALAGDFGPCRCVWLLDGHAQVTRHLGAKERVQRLPRADSIDLFWRL
jgi:hypothetical protein